MASIKDLYTREESNKPTDVKIGRESVSILGTDADVFRKAKIEGQRKIAEKSLSVDDFEAWLVAHLIVSWTFDEECTAETKFELLKNSPSLCEAIDRAASKRSDFLGKLRNQSSPTPKGSSKGGSRTTKASQKG